MTDIVPTTNRGRLSRMKSMSIAETGFHEPIRNMILNIPDDAEVHSVILADWPTIKWPNLGGRVTLLRDAAHHMAMYRGEGAKQGIRDAQTLGEQLHLCFRGEKTLEAAISDYEQEMICCARDAVLLSRQACLDAYDFPNLTRRSPLISRQGGMYLSLSASQKCIAIEISELSNFVLRTPGEDRNDIGEFQAKDGRSHSRISLIRSKINGTVLNYSCA
ncbi:hypothetical protein QBC38DRAFT_518277 [Podospora fimiseda]|uniref:FAD-binding domain-containing protein n=1 Tax=Podospora fimiseda TaxID=252190 RepID=A0AAN6YP95_9PEZI|nr:hypothetical protein QBC38DRAFT_518277 [Podospora fimiseda]